MLTKFSEALAERICELAVEGYEAKQIAEMIGVVEATLYNWRRAKPDFKARFDAARDSASSRCVEASLYKRALGYEITEEKLFYDPKRGEVIREQVGKHYPPEVRAAEFWLTNREPERWKPATTKLDATLQLGQAPQVQVLLPDNLRQVQATLDKPEPIAAEALPPGKPE